MFIEEKIYGSDFSILTSRARERERESGFGIVWCTMKSEVYMTFFSSLSTPLTRNLIYLWHVEWKWRKTLFEWTVGGDCRASVCERWSEIFYKWPKNFGFFLNKFLFNCFNYNFIFLILIFNFQIKKFEIKILLKIYFFT